jgi:hypothetical protein
LVWGKCSFTYIYSQYKNVAKTTERLKFNQLMILSFNEGANEGSGGVVRGVHVNESAILLT